MLSDFNWNRPLTADQIENAVALRASSNPFFSHLTLSWDPQLTSTRLQVMDLTGRTVHQLLLPPGTQTHEIDLAHLPAGVYLVNLNGERSGYIRCVKLQ